MLLGERELLQQTQSLEMPEPFHQKCFRLSTQRPWSQRLEQSLQHLLRRLSQTWKKLLLQMSMLVLQKLFLLQQELLQTLEQLQKLEVTRMLVGNQRQVLPQILLLVHLVSWEC